jgi:hypothetical protein
MESRLSGGFLFGAVLSGRSSRGTKCGGVVPSLAFFDHRSGKEVPHKAQKPDA